MACHRDAARVTSMALNVAPHPAQRPLDLAHDLGHRDGSLGRAGAQRIVHHHHADSLACERRRQKGMLRLVECAPVPPVDENQHRGRRAARHVGRKDVERLTSAAAVGNVQRARPTGARQGRRVGPALQIIHVVRHQGPVVVHTLQPGRIVVGEVHGASPCACHHPGIFSTLQAR